MVRTLTFASWSEEVQKEITRISRAMGNSNVVLDSSVGYRLGWSPSRMAKALLIYDRKDYGVLLDITAGRLSIDDAALKESET